MKIDLSFREIISCIAVVCVDLILAFAVFTVKILEDENAETQTTVTSVDNVDTTK